MALYDISRMLTADMAVWPGDTQFNLSRNLSRDDGASVNLTTLTLSAHTGTHVDAPHHFADDAPSMDAADLSVYWGLAQVITVTKEGGALTPADLADYDLSATERLLVHSPASRLDPTRFSDRFVYPSPELADFLGRMGIILYGSDAPSMDAADDSDLPGHNALLRNKIAILEGLELSHVPDGIYELAALPLRIAGGDGSPVRAVLRS